MTCDMLRRSVVCKVVVSSDEGMRKEWLSKYTRLIGILTINFNYPCSVIVI